MSNGILPQGLIGKVEFFENHNADWSANAVAIGTTAAAVTALTTQTTAARAAYNAQQLAQDQAKAATQTFHDTVRALVDSGSKIIKQIKAKAATDGNSIYTLALLPVPALPSPVPPPGTPTAFTATLNTDGSLKLRWKCANPAGSQGTLYNISRKIGSGPFVAIGSSGTRSFIDATVPAGSASITYQILAVRTTAMGEAAQFIVNFGISESGAMSASVAPRLAA